MTADRSGDGQTPAEAGGHQAEDEPIDQDGVSSLRDVEAEAGDEQELRDDFDLDEREARELGVALDRTEPDEPPLD